MRKNRRAVIGLAAAGISLLATLPAAASSHREALTVLNEPCADNTDTYAWVSNGAHDKLYLIMDFNPLHEPGQGNGSQPQGRGGLPCRIQRSPDPRGGAESDRRPWRRQRTAVAAHWWH